jgi:hypothetical protein
MDLQLYLRVLWRFRIIVAVGAMLGIALAVLSFVQVNPSGEPRFRYRQDQQWVSYATLFVTQKGFPWGQLSTDEGPANRGARKTTGKYVGDPNRFSNLAVLYAQLATSDQVRELLRAAHAPKGQIDAAAVMSNQSNLSDPLPMVRIMAVSDTPRHAIALVVRTTDSFQRFLEAQQSRNEIAPDNRVLVTVLKRYDKPQLLTGRSMTLPVVVFLAVMILVSALVFVLENMRPRMRPVAPEETSVVPVADQARRTA